jgi:uncharacterized protein YnzC (UPF0291/DUF896 family)
MDNNLQFKINRLNELYSKVESGNQLSNPELNEQSVLRDEIINYFKFAVSKIKKKL